ncbi:MAG: hypothetical protein IPN52_12305 [Micrococcales bacterium]|nr:hypothetical protein [Micrococcales bacterium]
MLAGELAPGIVFYGFDLDVDQAPGRSPRNWPGDPGWFFVLEEQPPGIRFGLDSRTGSVGGAGQGVAPASWDDLTWANVASADAQEAPTFIDLAATPGFGAQRCQAQAAPMSGARMLRGRPGSPFSVPCN